jgi:hypothetical protein
MNLRVRRVQEVFDILATTLWVVTAPKQEGRPARGLGLKGDFFWLSKIYMGECLSYSLSQLRTYFTYGQIS